MKKKLPIGLSDFKELIEDNYYYVDKSLFIKEIIDDGSKVILLPRPRRFGKTLNLSMLRYFYEKQDKDTNYLFRNLYIYEHEEYIQKQGQYPVIYITFKDIKDSCWDDSFSKIKGLLFKECTRHKYLLDSDILSFSRERTI